MKLKKGKLFLLGAVCGVIGSSVGNVTDNWITDLFIAAFIGAGLGVIYWLIAE
jgi:hypothetical protein